MSNLNYGYPSSNNTSFSSFSSQFSSTPSGSSTRFQRPRFAYSGPPSYPRPRSSASKPNPDPYIEPIRSSDYGSNLRSISSYQNTTGDSTRDYASGYSDSMANNYGDSPIPMDSSLNNSRDSFPSSQHNANPNAYYSANDSYYQPPQSTFSSYSNDGSQYNLSSKGGHTSFGVDNNKRPLSYYNTNVGGLSNFPSGTLGPIPMDTQSEGPIGTYGKTNTKGRGGSFGGNKGKRGNFKGRSQKNKTFGGGEKQQSSAMSGKWKCTTCSIDFTSQIPLEMHLRGSKHAKKLKAQNALCSIQGQTSQVKEIEKPDGKKFFCELCNVVANSSLQLQMHLDGTKHKNKLNPKEESKEGAEGKKILNGKSNGGVTRSAPAEFGEPQPSKMSKYSCDICDIVVNSDTQLQQHLTSKKHQAKVEGKPIIKKKKIKDDETNEQPAEEEEFPSDTKAEITNVVGVKTLSASFVQGGTLE